jgi:hypothetical protein
VSGAEVAVGPVGGFHTSQKRLLRSLELDTFASEAGPNAGGRRNGHFVLNARNDFVQAMTHRLAAAQFLLRHELEENVVIGE